jgi:hypothetical protein
MRKHIVEYVSTPPETVSPLLLAISACESCIEVLARALKLAHRIRKDRYAPNIHRKHPLIADAVLERVKDIRDTIQHWDERIVGGEVTTEEPKFLFLSNDGLHLASETISFGELADWIRQLHALADEMARYKEKAVTDA